MPGSDNNVQYSQGYRFEASQAQDILLMQKAATDISHINFNATPEGAVSANPGSYCADRVAGTAYIKNTGTGNTGWAQFVNDIPNVGISTLWNFNMPYTNATGSIGVLNMGGSPFLHDGGNIGNTIVGTAAGNFTIAGNTSLFGYQAGLGITSGISNNCFGTVCGQGLQDGSNNCLYGFQTGLAGGSIMDNSCYGYANLSNSTNTAENCSFGTNVLNALGNCAGFNSAFGSRVLASLQTGIYNACFGAGSGSAYGSTESSNILIMNAGVALENNTMRIGTDGSGDGQVNQCFIAGISGVTSTGAVPVVINASGQLGTVVSSKRYKENIQDLEGSILDLRPVSFNYISDESKVFTSGLIAEEVAEVMPSLVVYKDEEPETVKYHELCNYLLLEVKRLNSRVSELEKAA